MTDLYQYLSSVKGKAVIKARWRAAGKREALMHGKTKRAVN